MGDARAPDLAPNLPAPRGDDNFLPPADRIRAGRRITSRRQGRFPQQLTGRLVERAELRVHRGGDKDEPARGDDRSAILLCTRIRTGRVRQRRMLTQRNSPTVLAGVEIDRAQLTPRLIDAL